MDPELKRNIIHGMELAFLRQVADDIRQVTDVRRDLITKRFDRKGGERPSRRAAWAKQDLIYLARTDLGVRVTTIAEFLGISHTYCSHAVEAVRNRIETCPAYEQRIKRIRERGNKPAEHDEKEPKYMGQTRPVLAGGGPSPRA